MADMSAALVDPAGVAEHLCRQLREQGFAAVAIALIGADGRVGYRFAGETWRSLGEVLGAVSVTQASIAGCIASNAEAGNADDPH